MLGIILIIVHESFDNINNIIKQYYGYVMKNYELLLEMQKLAGMITEQELNEMARPSTPFSRALNDLISKNPSITTAEIRKQLADLGIEPPANLSVRINHMRKFVADKQGGGKQEDGEAKAVAKKEPAQPKENKPAPKKAANIKNVFEDLKKEWDGHRIRDIDFTVSFYEGKIEVYWNLTFRRSTPYDAYMEHRNSIDRANEILKGIADKYKNDFDVKLRLTDANNKSGSGNQRYSEYEQSIVGQVFIANK